MKKAIKLFLLFSLALGVFLAATLPVTFLLPYLPKSVPLVVSGAQGTVWKGSATEVSWQRQSLGKLEWKVHPTSLLLARVNTDFKLSGNVVHADGNATIKRDQSIFLKNTFLDADITKLPLPQQNMLVTPEGRVNATVRSMFIEKQKINSADADILWSDAKVTSPASIELGQVSLNISGKDGNLDGILDSKGGAIKASGKLSVDPQGMLKANLQLTPDANTPAEVKDMLPMIGRPDKNGAVKINQKIRIPNWPA